MLRRGVDATTLAAHASALRSANDLWLPATMVTPGMASLRDTLERVLGRPILLTGSGSTLFALYPSPAAATLAANDLRAAADRVAVPDPRHQLDRTPHRDHQQSEGPMTRSRISTPGAPSAVGPYSQGIDAGDTVYCSGQVGLDPQSGELVQGGLETQTERALRNLGAVLEAAGLGYGDVVKTTCFLIDIGDFAAFNAIYARYFPEPPPARSTFAVAALPKGRTRRDRGGRETLGSVTARHGLTP